MTSNIDIGSIADITTAINDYNILANSFTQIDPSQRETIDPFWKKAIRHAKDQKYMDYTAGQFWKSFDFYYVEQMWSNTSGGWQGIGGSAFTANHTFIIYNRYNEAIFVYYGSVLAYVAYANEKLKPFMDEGFIHLPGIRECSKKLDIIYIKKSWGV